MSDFETAAEEELRAVYEELTAYPLFQKWERLTELVVLYRGQPTSGESRFARSAPPKRLKRQSNPEKDKALRLAEEALKGLRTPVKTAEIYDIIVPQGAVIGGTSPKGNLSAMLWKSEKFRSHGRDGWTLEEYGIGDDDARALEGRDPSDNVIKQDEDDLLRL